MLQHIRIDYADGRAGFGEVVVDIDRAYAHMPSALRQIGGGIPWVLDAPGLRCVWTVSLSGAARLRQLEGELSGLLAAVERYDEVTTKMQGQVDLQRDGCPWFRWLSERGVAHVSWRPVEPTETGRVSLYPQGTRGPAQLDWPGFIGWIDSFVGSELAATKRQKLAAAVADERHLFVGTSYTTAWEPHYPLRAPNTLMILV